jgi:hypothetical protein
MDSPLKKLSWSHRLFVTVNHRAGRTWLYDWLVRIWAEYAIFGLAIAVLGWLLVHEFILTVFRLGLAWLVGGLSVQNCRHE